MLGRSRGRTRSAAENRVPKLRVSVTPCCAEKYLVKRLARLGEHMQVLQNARLNETPCWRRRVMPGWYRS